MDLIDAINSAVYAIKLKSNYRLNTMPWVEETTPGAESSAYYIEDGKHTVYFIFTSSGVSVEFFKGAKKYFNSMLDWGDPDFIDKLQSYILDFKSCCDYPYWLAKYVSGGRDDDC